MEKVDVNKAAEKERRRTALKGVNPSVVVLDAVNTQSFSLSYVSSSIWGPLPSSITHPEQFPDHVRSQKVRHV